MVFRISVEVMVLQILEHVELQKEMRKLVAELRQKALEFKDILKMGRTQLQDGTCPPGLYCVPVGLPNGLT